MAVELMLKCAELKHHFRGRWSFCDWSRSDMPSAWAASVPRDGNLVEFLCSISRYAWLNDVRFTAILTGYSMPLHARAARPRSASCIFRRRVSEYNADRVSLISSVREELSAATTRLRSLDSRLHRHGTRRRLFWDRRARANKASGIDRCFAARSLLSVYTQQTDAHGE